MKGEMRVRETTPADREEARWNKEVMRQRGLPENYRKSDHEIAILARKSISEEAIS
jgi:hypothetical protein